MLQHGRAWERAKWSQSNRKGQLLCDPTPTLSLEESESETRGRLVGTRGRGRGRGSVVTGGRVSVWCNEKVLAMGEDGGYTQCECTQCPWTVHLKTVKIRASTGSPVVRILYSLPRTWVRSPVRELRSHKPCCMDKNKELKTVVYNVGTIL